jgi:hypothetical protein
VVYLWVDGEDPEWRRRRQQAEKEYFGAEACRFSNVEGRFRDNDELRYSLRSLMPHLDSFGQIFIITDRQTPCWLAQHPRISVIDHADLRGMNMEPTYSSKALEAHFDRLPTVQDIVYLNDDVFLGDGFSLQHLFDSFLQKTIVHFEKEEDQDPLHDVSQNSAMHVSHNILKPLFSSQHFRHSPMGHAPRYLIRADLEEAFDCFPRAAEQARTEIFRESTRPSFTADLYPRWLLAKGRAIEKPVAHMLLSSGAPLIAQQLGELVKNFNQLSFFCINDTLDNTPNSHDVFPLIRSTLQQLFPEPSEFELDHDSENNRLDDIDACHNSRFC